MRTLRSIQRSPALSLVVGLLGAWGLGCGGSPDTPAPAPEPGANRAPTLSQVTPQARTSLDEGSGLDLSVLASDPEGDPLTSAWTQSPALPRGSFVEGAGGRFTWTAPFLSRDTDFTLTVTVSDGKGGQVQGSVPARVLNVAALNHAPDVYADISVGAERIIVGDSVRVFIGASDQDGDALTYAWSTAVKGAGVFIDPTQASAQWIAPESSRAASHVVRVTVSDGVSAVTRQVTVNVGMPSYARDIQPLWDHKCADCHNAYGAERLNLQSGASYASLVNVPAVGACGPTARVKPGNVGESLLLWRLTAAECGPRMPQGSSDHFERNPGELIRIRSWIAAGALND